MAPLNAASPVQLYSVCEENAPPENADMNRKRFKKTAGAAAAILVHNGVENPAIFKHIDDPIVVYGWRPA